MIPIRLKYLPDYVLIENADSVDIGCVGVKCEGDGQRGHITPDMSIALHVYFSALEMDEFITYKYS